MFIRERRDIYFLKVHMNEECIEEGQERVQEDLLGGS